MLSLLLEGGGMRAGFAAGALLALMDKGLVGFDKGLAVSASVPTLAYFAAGQRREIEEVWRNELSSPRLVQYRNLPAVSLALSSKRALIDLDYLVYEVFKKRYPLDVDSFRAGPMECSFAAAGELDGSLTLLNAGDGDPYEIFKACMVIPGCYPFTVPVGGRALVDGGTANPLPASSLFGSEDCRVLAVLTKPLDCDMEPPGFLERTIFWRYFHKHEQLQERLWESANRYNEEVFFLENLVALSPPRAFLVFPDRMPPARFITRDRRKINRTINMGYAKVSALEAEIRKFLDG